MNKILNISEAAKYLRVSKDTIRRWGGEGILSPVSKPGKHRLFKYEDLEWLKLHKPLTISEAAGYLGLSVSTLRRLERKNILVAKRNIHGGREYSRDLLDLFIRSDYYLNQQGKRLRKPSGSESSGFWQLAGLRRHAYQMGVFVAFIALTVAISGFGLTATPADDFLEESLESQKVIEQSQILSWSEDVEVPTATPLGTDMQAKLSARHAPSQTVGISQATVLGTYDYKPGIGPLGRAPTYTEGRGGMDFRGEKVHINEQGDVQLEVALTVDKLNLNSGTVDTASVGSATIEEGAVEVTVYTNTVTEDSKIFTSPTTELTIPLAVVGKASGKSFTVRIAIPQPKDIPFDWWIVN